MPPGDCGQLYPSPGPPQKLTGLPDGSKRMTSGATLQHVSAVGGSVESPISVRAVIDGAPRCTIQTWFCASTATPVIDPSTQWLGRGLGQKGSTWNVGTWGAWATSVPIPITSTAPRVNALRMPS